MLKLSKTLLVVSVILLFFSCGKSNSPTSSVIAQSDRIISSTNYSARNPQQNSSIDDPAIQRFLVPPEIAVMQATIQVKSNSFSEVANLIDTNSSKVVTSISQVKGCSAEIVNYQYPRETYGKRIVNETPTYLSSLEIKTIISFAGMNTVEQRIKQLNSCLQAIPQLKLEKASKNSDINLSFSEVIPTVSNADSYRKQLLENKFTRLREIANLSETPSQFKASDTKCTSNGTVRVRNRSLSNIELDIDFKCLQFNK